MRPGIGAEACVAHRRAPGAQCFLVAAVFFFIRVADDRAASDAFGFLIGPFVCMSSAGGGVKARGSDGVKRFARKARPVTVRSMRPLCCGRTSR